MRYSLAVLMLVTTLPEMGLQSAPAPDPSAILDIGPPPKGETAEQHRNSEIDYISCPHGALVRRTWRDPSVRKLPSAAALKDPVAWIARNLRVTSDGKANHLRLTFRAGTRAEQAAIINSILRNYIEDRTSRLQWCEKGLQIKQAGEPRLAKLIRETKDPDSLQHYLQEQENLKVMKGDYRAEIARLKQIAVIKWAK